MNDWRKVMTEEWNNLARESQGGTAFETHVIDADRGYESLIERGNKGDLEARSLVYCIGAWFDYANAAQADGVYPKCVSCKNDIRPGEVCAWFLLMPIEKEKQGSMAGVVCPDCFPLGPREITKRAMNQLEREGAISIATRQ